MENECNFYDYAICTGRYDEKITEFSQESLNTDSPCISSWNICCDIDGRTYAIKNRRIAENDFSFLHFDTVPSTSGKFVKIPKKIHETNACIQVFVLKNVIGLVINCHYDKKNIFYIPLQKWRNDNIPDAIFIACLPSYSLRINDQFEHFVFLSRHDSAYILFFDPRREDVPEVLPLSSWKLRIYRMKQLVLQQDKCTFTYYKYDTQNPSQMEMSELIYDKKRKDLRMCPIDILHSDVLVHIFYYLGVVESMRVSCVSKKWKNTINSLLKNKFASICRGNYQSISELESRYREKLSYDEEFYGQSITLTYFEESTIYVSYKQRSCIFFYMKDNNRQFIKDLSNTIILNHWNAQIVRKCENIPPFHKCNNIDFLVLDPKTGDTLANITGLRRVNGTLFMSQVTSTFAIIACQVTHFSKPHDINIYIVCAKNNWELDDAPLFTVSQKCDFMQMTKNGKEIVTYIITSDLDFYIVTIGEDKKVKSVNFHLPFYDHSNGYLACHGKLYSTNSRNDRFIEYSPNGEQKILPFFIPKFNSSKQNGNSIELLLDGKLVEKIEKGRGYLYFSPKLDMPKRIWNCKTKELEIMSNREFVPFHEGNIMSKKTANAMKPLVTRDGYFFIKKEKIIYQLFQKIK